MQAFAQKQNQPQLPAASKGTSSNSSNHHPRPILHLQRTIGNQAVQRLLNVDTEGLEVESSNIAAARFAYDFSQIPVYATVPVKAQTKLTANTRGDLYEQEGNPVADQVIRMPDAQLQRACACGASTGTACTKCNQEESMPRSLSSSTPASVQQVLNGPGLPLHPAVRSFMEPRFGHDFSSVRVHADATAAQSARDIHARAYTLGSHIVFGSGQYAPGTPQGNRLLAHELTHVVQQDQSPAVEPSASRISRPDDPSEREADRVAANVDDSGRVERRPDMVTRGVSLLQRDASNPPPPPGNVLFPHFPGCDPALRPRLDFQVLHAQGLVTEAIGGLTREIARPAGGSGIITIVGSAFSGQFHSGDPAVMKTVLGNLQTILPILQRGPDNFQCQPSNLDCRKKCSVTDTPFACAGPSIPIQICPAHFEQGDTEGAITLVHEAAHQAGLMRNVLESQATFKTLTTAQTLTNADSYAKFTRDVRYGGPLKPASGPSAWSSRDLFIGIDLYSTIPQLRGDLYGTWGGFQRHIPASLRRIGKKIHLEISFSVDSGGGGERKRPYTPPRVSVHVVFHPASKAPDQTLLSWVDPAPVDQGVGSNLKTAFSGILDYTFAQTDVGTVHIAAELADPDSATAIRFDEDLQLSP